MAGHGQPWLAISPGKGLASQWSAKDPAIKHMATFGLYVGHGKSKVVYKVTDEPQVLKLTARKDEEPDVCQQLSSNCSAVQPDLKICPTIYTVGRCQEQDQWGKPTREWFAWLAEYAFPLDKYMQDMHVDRKACLKIALYKQVLAAQHVSDAEVRNSTAVRRLH